MREIHREVSPHRGSGELRFKDYEQIRTRDEEEFDEEQDWEDEWESGYILDFPELDSMNMMDDFLDDFDSMDEDVYKEPA